MACCDLPDSKKSSLAGQNFLGDYYVVCEMLHQIPLMPPIKLSYKFKIQVTRSLDQILKTGTDCPKKGPWLLSSCHCVSMSFFSCCCLLLTSDFSCCRIFLFLIFTLDLFVLFILNSNLSKSYI